MSHILQLTAENIKRLKAVSITPTGNVVIIGGENASGKSSVLDAIAMALGGKDEVPEQPIHKGETRAKIIADLGDLVIERTFTAAGGTQLVIKDKKGVRQTSPQTILDNLTGKVTFDPLVFMRLGKKERADTLRKLVGVDLEPLDEEREALYDERTGVNREVERLRALAGNMLTFADVPEKEVVAVEVSAAEVMARLDAMEKINAVSQASEMVVQHKQMALEVAVGLCTSAQATIDSLNNALEQARLEYNAKVKARVIAEEAVTTAKSLVSLAVDVAPIRAQLTQLEQTNAKARSDAAQINTKIKSNAARAVASKDVQAKAAESAVLTKKIEEIDAKKERLLRETKFPVSGLSFSGAGVVFNGIPFEQASDAEKLRISVGVAAALNPKLRVMLVRDGSLLDNKSMALLGELATTQNLQIWIERVGKGSECSVIIEDGEVESKDGNYGFDPTILPIPASPPSAETLKNLAAVGVIPPVPAGNKLPDLDELD